MIFMKIALISTASASSVDCIGKKDIEVEIAKYKMNEWYWLKLCLVLKINRRHIYEYGYGE